MSIEEFLDGMPTFDERNFSQFYPRSSITRRIPVHIKKNITITTDTPSEQDHQVPGPINKKWDLKIKDKKKESNEIVEESGPSSKKRPRI